MIRVYYTEILGLYGLPSTIEKALIIYNENTEQVIRYDEIPDGMVLDRATLEEQMEYFSKHVCDDKDFAKRWETGKGMFVSNITKDHFALLLASFYYYEVLATYEDTEAKN